MKSSKSHDFDMTLTARTEDGRCALEMDLDHLSPIQRGFIFSSMAATLKGGSTGFGMRTLENGDIVIEITLTTSNHLKALPLEMNAAMKH